MSKRKPAFRYGFIYLWFDRKHKRYYIGSHWGTTDDGYICSSPWMNQAYKKRPDDFHRIIVCRVFTNRTALFKIEHHYLNMIPTEELGKGYYNLHNKAFGHWSTDPQKYLSVPQKAGMTQRGKVLTEAHKEKISQGINSFWDSPGAEAERVKRATKLNPDGTPFKPSRACKWIVIPPNEKPIEVFNLKQYCTEKRISYSHLTMGKSMGYSACRL